MNIFYIKLKKSKKWEAIQSVIKENFAYSTMTKEMFIEENKKHKDTIPS